MNRRDFIKMLAAAPALAWLKPEVTEVTVTPALEETELDIDALFDSFNRGEIKKLSFELPNKVVKWDGVGNSWEWVGENWNQTGRRPTLEIQPDGALYIRGDFLHNAERAKEEKPT